MKLFWVTLIILQVSCSTFSNKSDFSVLLTITQKIATALPNNSMPSDGLIIKTIPIDQKKMSQISTVLGNFNKNGDRLVSQIFFPIYGSMKSEVHVIVTDGVPAPYDAWTADYNGVPTVFINLSMWDEDRIETSLLPIIKHEVSHVLMKPSLIKPKSKLEELNYIVVNEGIAHFIGYIRNREEILRSKQPECKLAERKLKAAIDRLKSKINKRESDEIIQTANTGSFWTKFGSIGGMCRAALIYSKYGSGGLTAAIKNSYLPTTD